MRALVALALALALAVSACGPSKPPFEEDPLLDAEKDDSFRQPTDHGAIVFGQPMIESLDRGTRYHAWGFTLRGDASVRIATSYGGRGTPDTVVYLYRRGTTGWGGAIAKNDDASSTSSWSTISRALGAGQYRVIVKGYRANEVGRFKLAVECSGAGCTMAPPAACLFGDTFGDLVDGATPVRVTVRNTWTAASASTLSALQGAQIVRALHASTHTDVTTVAEAFAAADQGEINMLALWDERGARSFVAVEYGAGDNSYGALFPSDSAEPVAQIHDGDLESCTVKAETCLFTGTFHDLRTGATGSAFVIESQKVLTASSALTPTESAQLLAAVKESYADVATVAQAFAAVDGDQVNQFGLRDRGTGRRFTAYEYGAGDNSYGAIFTAATISRAVAIHDGDFTNCAAFR